MKLADDYEVGDTIVVIGFSRGKNFFYACMTRLEGLTTSLRGLYRSYLRSTDESGGITQDREGF